jgi:hypothetical protein
VPSDSDSDNHAPSHRKLNKASRHASDVNLAARAQIAEEGKALRLGQALKRKKGEKGELQLGEHQSLLGEEEAVGDEEDHDVVLLKEKLRDLEKREMGRVGDDEE